MKLIPRRCITKDTVLCSSEAMLFHSQLLNLQLSVWLQDFTTSLREGASPQVLVNILEHLVTESEAIGVGLFQVTREPLEHSGDGHLAARIEICAKLDHKTHESLQSSSPVSPTFVYMDLVAASNAARLPSVKLEWP